MKNDFCDSKDLSNESSVEQFFVARLLVSLGYTDSQIKTKESIDTLAVSLGRKKVKYKPDYVVMLRRRPRIVIDAKTPAEDISEWTGQCSSYCLELNKNYADNPVELFIVTNGIRTALYQWDKADPLLVLEFSDFTEKNRKYQKLLKQAGEKAVLSRVKEQSGSTSRQKKVKEGEHLFDKLGIDDVNYAFAWCHKQIYRKDNISQAAAFNEFIKLMFLKLLSDKRVHDLHPDAAATKRSFTVPSADVTFSIAWIEELASATDNPVADISFVKLRKQLEDEITEGRKKRMFDRDEELTLSPETITGVVERLEHIDLYSIDHDLNGRLFETFLNATMRGKDLGQYFTPRSVVKLMIAVSGLDATSDPKQQPLVLDPCCGSGGFLIDAMACLWRSVDANPSMTDKKKAAAKHALAQTNIMGFDIGREPPIARIARINMYLHGDGGSRIYQVDSLDKELSIPASLDSERKRELRELRDIASEGGFADVILTNPPFSKVYQSQHKPEKQILRAYDVGTQTHKGRQDIKSSVKSSVLFLERYWDFLKEDGRVVAIIDDSILGSKKYLDIRTFIRSRYIIESVISLPGDAFQRSKARVKTSIIILRKKTDQEEKQAAVFMYYCTAVGLDDSARQRSLPIDRENRKLAQKEITRVASLLASFKQGKASRWTVPASRLTERLDVKSCLPKPERLVATWKEDGHKVCPLSDLVQVFDEDNMDDADVIYTADSDERVVFLRVRYDGTPELGDEKNATDTDYSVLLRVHTDDVVISNINAVHGAIAVVTGEFDGCVVSSEYTICRAREGVDPRAVWLLTRSPEARADLVLLASGIGRTRVQWENARNLMVALPHNNTISRAVQLLNDSEAMRQSAVNARNSAETLFNDNLGLDNPEAWNLINAFKPPK